MDKYTKFILTVIAIGILGINFKIYSGEIITNANAATVNGVTKIAICDEYGNTCAEIKSDMDNSYFINVN